MLMKTETIVRPDGFVFLIVERNVAIQILRTKTNGPEVCIVHDDGIDTLVEQIDQLYESEEPIGLAVGFISDLVIELQAHGDE